jgi:Domain of unknown function (DUF6362)
MNKHMMRLRRRAVHGLTAARMAEAIEEAVDSLRRLNRTTHADGPAIYARSVIFPRVLRDIWEAYGRYKPRPSIEPPTAAAIDRLDAVLACIAGALPQEERLLIWMRASNVRWKRIESQYGRSRHALWRTWVIALWKLTSYANARGFAKILVQQNFRAQLGGNGVSMMHTAKGAQPRAAAQPPSAHDTP